MQIVISFFEFAIYLYPEWRAQTEALKFIFCNKLTKAKAMPMSMSMLKQL